MRWLKVLSQEKKISHLQVIQNKNNVSSSVNSEMKGPVKSWFGDAVLAQK